MQLNSPNKQTIQHPIKTGQHLFNFKICMKKSTKQCILYFFVFYFYLQMDMK